MKTPAIIASLTVAGSIAFAAGQQSVSRQSVAVANGMQAHSLQEEPHWDGVATGECAIEGEDKTWFTTIHLLRLDGCLPPGTYIDAADLNCDGVFEYCRSNDGYGRFYVNQAFNPNAALLNLHDVQQGEGGRLQITHSLLRGSAMLSFVQSMFPSATYTSGMLRFRDMDQDRDLDIVFEAYASGADGQLGRLTGWIENTELECGPAPLAGDLDRDGRVGGADLGILLGAWDPNP